MENDMQTGARPSGKIEKIAIAFLSAAFLAVLAGAGWDLYGREALTGYLCAPSRTESGAMSVPAQTAAAPGENASGGATSATSARPAVPAGKPAVSGEVGAGYAAYATCLENVKDERAAKDCCDCLAAEAATRKACRDAAVNYDFGKNTVFKAFTAPSRLGPGGDYSAFTASGDERQCKQACESSSSGLACGDYQYCRTACNALAR